MDSNFRLLPEQASTMAPRVDALFWFITGVCVFFTLLIAILLMFFAVRYRRRTEDYYPKPLLGSKTLETLWSVIPLGLTLVIFFWGANVYFDLLRTPHATGERTRDMSRVRGPPCPMHPTTRAPRLPHPRCSRQIFPRPLPA